MLVGPLMLLVLLRPLKSLTQWPFRPFSSRNWCYSGHWWAMMLLGPLGPLVGPLGPLMPFGPFRPPAGA